MSREYDNSGVLFKNENKAQPNHCDYDGHCTIDGVDYFMNAWLKDKNGKKFMSFAFKKKNKQGGGAEGGNNNSGSQEAADFF